MRLENEDVSLDLVLPHRAEFAHHLSELVHPLLPGLFLDVEDLHQSLHCNRTVMQPNLLLDSLQRYEALTFVVNLNTSKVGLPLGLIFAVGLVRCDMYLVKVLLVVLPTVGGGLSSFDIDISSLLLLLFSHPALILGHELLETGNGGNTLRCALLIVIITIIINVVLNIGRKSTGIDLLSLADIDIVVIEQFVGVVIQLLIFGPDIPLVEIILHGHTVVASSRCAVVVSTGCGVLVQLLFTTVLVIVTLVGILGRRDGKTAEPPLAAKHGIVLSTEDTIIIDCDAISQRRQQLLPRLARPALALTVRQIAHNIVVFSIGSGRGSGLGGQLAQEARFGHPDVLGGPNSTSAQYGAGLGGHRPTLLGVHHVPRHAIALVVHGLLGFVHG
mmetsp:Transcript_18490/g.53060  ORF Transcript_18490/g.53060 Transcript_18490/m.53060 type:complete len:387 (-) Transcript_18490:761-1921(-)